MSQTGYYWPDEAPVFSKEAINALTMPIDTIITHTSPSFCGKQDRSDLHAWAVMDPALFDDVTEERRTMDQIYEYLKECGIHIRNWIYGHYHESWTSFIGGARFKMLDIMEFFELM